MTFGDIKNQLLIYASQSSGDDYATMLPESINAVYQEILGISEPERVYTLTSVASTSKYGLPMYVKTILNVEDTTTPRSLSEIFRDDFDKLYPGTTDSDDSPRFYFEYGTFGVQRQPATALTLKVSSSSASDATNFFVRIYGQVSGIRRTEQITLTGTSVVTSTLTYDINGVERIIKSATGGYSWSGVVTVTDGTNTLTTIPVAESSPSHKWIQLHPIPSLAMTYNVRCLAHIPNLLNDDDWPEFDADFHDLIVWGVGADTLALVGKQSLADRMKIRYEARLKKFAGDRSKKPNLEDRQFRDVVGQSSIPRRPLIQNIDYV